jgi:drug/metabolite transporter (DMT)-like permease
VSTLEPVVTVLSSVFFLSEKLTLNIVFGGILVLTALIVTTLSTKKDSTNSISHETNIKP